jgi:hypothetical protein
MIMREYVISWALGTLFGVTQEVHMVTMRASNFGRFAVAVLEPDAIPTKLDVIYLTLNLFHQTLDCGA